VEKHGKENAMREGKGKETMKQMRKIDNSRDAQLLFLLCWFAYFFPFPSLMAFSFPCFPTISLSISSENRNNTVFQ